MNIFISPSFDLNSNSWLTLSIMFVGYVLIRALILQGGLYFFLEKLGACSHKKIYQVAFQKNQLRSELQANLTTFFFDAFFVASLIKYGPPQVFESRDLFVGFSISFIWFEIWFYLSHRLLHSRHLYFIHEQHHTAKVTSPLTGMSFSILERALVLTGGLLPLVLISQTFSLSTAGVALYFFTNYILNLYGHSNREFIPPHWIQSPIGQILNTSTYHALHHARYNGHFGLFTPYMDLIFNSCYSDYRVVQKMAYQGHGLNTLGQRPPKPVALITGASSGIGKALAFEYANKGYRVILLARNYERIYRFKQQIGESALAIQADVTDRSSLDLAVNQAINTFGQIDLVVANAGIAVYGKAESLQIEDYKRQFETNIYGVLNTLHAALPSLEKSKGQFAILGSAYSYITTPAMSPYTMSKFAVRALAESLQPELKSKKIAVTLICPGLIESEMRLTNLDGTKNLQAEEPAPQFLVMKADVAAKKIKKAIDQKKRVIFITNHAKFAVFMRTYFPRTYACIIMSIEKLLVNIVLRASRQT